MLISIVIPCRDEKFNVDGLLKDISNQAISFDKEIIKITGISPPSKARNAGAQKGDGEILIFIDCDIRLGDNLFLTNLIKYLTIDKDIGAVCASIRIPPDSSCFQIRYSKEILHSESPIVEKLTDVFVASSACCAIKRDIFFEIGGFNGDIIRGEDSVLSHQLKESGYRVVLAPQTWCYHPQPKNIIQLIRIQFRNGLGVSFVDVFYPELNIDVHPEGIIYISNKKNISQRIVRFIISILDAIFEIKILLVLARIFYFVGYLFGVYKYKILNIKL